MVYIGKMKYGLAIKQASLPFVMTWVYLEDIMLKWNKVKQRQILYSLIYISNLKEEK